jgi:hypothetical protein
MGRACESRLGYHGISSDILSVAGSATAGHIAMAFLCKACGSQGPHPVHVFREMMFGTREKFEYIEYNDCGSIQRLTEVSDESRFYPNNYYSFSHIRPSLRSRISVLRDSHALGVTTRRLLSSTGRCLIRIPTCSSFAWRHDGSNWV